MPATPLSRIPSCRHSKESEDPLHSCYQLQLLSPPGTTVRREEPRSALHVTITASSDLHCLASPLASCAPNRGDCWKAPLSHFTHCVTGPCSGPVPKEQPSRSSMPASPPWTVVLWGKCTIRCLTCKCSGIPHTPYHGSRGRARWGL